MARPLRVEYPGAFYHVINRGNAGEHVIGAKRDKEKLLEYLAQAADRFCLSVHGYCIMDNHYHLIVETAEANLSLAVQWINISYASWYNKKHNRQGHVFQGRFKSYLVDADDYLIALSRYIHLNPVRANIVAQPAEYDWSSYRLFLEKQNSYDWLETERVLLHFSLKRKVAQRKYKAYVEEIDIKDVENPNRKAIAGFIIGGEQFVEWIQENFLSVETDREIPQLKRLKAAAAPTPDRIVGFVSKEYSCSIKDILQRNMKDNPARKIAMYITRKKSCISNKKLGEYFGGITGAGVTMQCKRFEETMKRNKKLKIEVENMMSSI